METEIKLLARPDDIDTLLHSATLQRYATRTPVEHLLADTYFDTPDRALKNQHAALRLRKSGDHVLQTLKVGSASDSALSRRQEYETPVRGERPRFSSLRKLAGRKGKLGALLHSRTLKRHLAPIFSTSIKRTVFPLTLPQGDVVECAVDVGEITGNGAAVSVCEVELELKSGDVAHLFDLALELSADVQLAAGMTSKGERGYALLDNAGVVASKATPVLLKKNMTVEHAFTEILGNCIGQIEANAAGVARSDSESLHQMRVGLRRFRSALHLLDGLIGLPDALQAETDWLGNELGVARDWDVLAHATLGELSQSFPTTPQLAQVTQAAMNESEQSRQRAAAAVASPRYARLTLLLNQWRLRAVWRDFADAGTLAQLDAPIIGFARQALAASHKRLLKRGHQLNGASPEARHRIRIAAKKARYASEFFQSLFNAGEVRAFVKRLSGLQDGFGRLNDVAVAERLLTTLREKQPELEGSTEYVKGFLAASMENGARDAQKIWRKFTPAHLPH
jgi:triphosphatase